MWGYASFWLLTLWSSMISPNYPWIKYKHIACSVYSCKSASHNFTPTISGYALGRSTAGPIRRLTFIDNPIKLQLTADIQVKSRGQLIPGYVRYLSACTDVERWSMNGSSRNDGNNVFFFSLPDPRFRFPFLILPFSSFFPLPVRQYILRFRCICTTGSVYVRTNLEPGNDYTNKKTTQLWWRWQR